MRRGLGNTCGTVVFLDLVGDSGWIILAMAVFDTSKSAKIGIHIFVRQKSNYPEIKSNPMGHAGHRNYCVEADLAVMCVVSQVQDR